MTKKILLTCTIGLLFILSAIVWPHAISLPFKLLKLQTAQPDTALIMPVFGVEVKEVPDTWNAERSEGRRHEGQDIFAATGTPIYSATYGIVIDVGENRLGGNTVSVLEAGGRTYYYAHLNTYGPDAIVGREVGTTSILGYVGNTGNATSTPPHLHFGVYSRSGVINPLPLLVDRG